MTKIIKRRSFLKYAAAGVSAVAIEHYLSPLLAAKQSEDSPYVNRSTGKKVKGIVSTCAGCRAGCGIVGYVEDGQLMKVSGNPAHPVNGGALCLVGQAGMYTVYDPERALKPLMRVGKRGQGLWKEVGWDEAVSEIEKNIKALHKKGLVLETKGGFTDPVSREFLAGMGGGTLISHDYVISPNRKAALMGTFGVPYDVPDITNTKYILNFGANPFESDPFGVGTIAAITKTRSRDSSVKMVTFDPRLSPTAGRSDEWYPLLPGTDAVVALAMANVIMHEGLHDAGFIERRTNTSVAKLKSHLAAYTPSLAERISGVKADDIRRVAAEYAHADRAVLLTGGGVSKHGQGTENERAVRLLSIVTGKVDRTGCNLLPKGFGMGSDGPDVREMTPDSFHLSLKEKAERVGVYMVNGCDPVYSSPEPEEMKKALKDEAAIPFIVCMDTHVTDTGLYADIVLPTTTYLEEYGLEKSPGPSGYPVICYRQPVVPAGGESRPYIDTLLMISGKAGHSLGFEDSEEYVEMLAGRTEGLSRDGGMDRLAKNGFYVAAYGAREGHAAKGAKAAGAGKIDVAWKEGPQMPSFNQPVQYKNIREGEFVLVKYNPGAYREGVSENNLLLKEISHNNTAFINSEVGRDMGLKHMDKVNLVSPVGKVEVEVSLTPGMHPRTIALAAGCGHEGYGNIERAKCFKSQDPFTEFIWWWHEGAGVNPNGITPFNVDPAAGGQGWMLTKITVEKA